MVVLALSSGAVVLPMELVHCTKWINNEEHQNSSAEPQTITKQLKLGHNWVFQQNNNPKHAQKLAEQWIQQADPEFFKVLTSIQSKIYKRCIKVRSVSGDAHI